MSDNKEPQFMFPPNIVDEGTSGDMVAREGQDVSLSCMAEGRPLPRILWRREDGTNIQLRDETGELHKAAFPNGLCDTDLQDMFPN
ncbi:hypothetical protein MSG28_002948 [Choristoneura fumiferana]|uniref:Uncharacterized protein n=1 Tax=Choristoneura fumiferana TaxID=7141 RepID=A0ACC0JK03_CHOFU|nr:hypothetical protein MSG28_002948 [Choristoneura fumiferana]